MRGRVDLGSGLVAAGAAAVVVSLFLNWYEPGLTGWESFEVVDWGLLALGVVAVVMIGSETGGTRSAGSGLAWVVGAALLLVCAEIIDPPPVVPDGAGRDVGAWLGLAGALAMSAGVGLMLASISVTIDVRERERRVRVAAVDAREESAAEPDASEGAPTRRAQARRRRRAADEKAPGADAGGSAARSEAASGEAGSAGPAPDAPAKDPDSTQQMPVVDPTQADDVQRRTP